MDGGAGTGLTLAAGALLACGVLLAVAPRATTHGRTLRGLAAVAMMLGLGSAARAYALTEGPSAGDLASAAFRTHYVLWAMAAAAGPLLVRAIGSRPSLVPGLAAASTTLLVAAFAATPAFLGGQVTDVQPDALTIRWAFLGTVVLTTGWSGYSAVRLAGMLIGPLDRLSRELALAGAVGYMSLALMVPVMAASDAGQIAGRAFAAAPVVTCVAWIAASWLGLRAVMRRLDRDVRHARADLDSQFAQSIRDPLTGLFNRGYFFEAIHQAQEQLKRTGEQFAVCLIDLDDFKAVNDTYGHQAGDQTLQTVAKVLMRTCRPYDTAARYGGEEFVVVLRNVANDVAAMIAERVRKAVESVDVRAGQARIRVTATIGMVAVTRPDFAVAEMVRRVDEAMYQGKHRGKNQVFAG